MTQIELEQRATEERKQYFANWRKRNKDKTRLHRQRYWEKRVLKKLEGGAVNER